MIRKVFLGIVILLLCAGTGAIAQDPTAAGLWYPGGIGSYWKYELPPAQKTTATFTKSIKVDSKTYQLIEETVSFFGVINPTLGYDPFLTFRQEGLDRIWGYGKAANELFEGILTDLLQELLREAGFWQVIAKTQATSDEWLLLETSNIGHEWTVMQLETTSNVGVRGLYEIGARLHEAKSIQTKAGEFNGFAAEYFTRYTIFNEFGLRVAEQEEPLFIAWLAPGVGIVQVAMDNEIIGRLVEYHIEGAELPNDKPTITSIDPSSGAPGILVTIKGYNFDEIVVIQQVTFGGKSATIKEWTNEKIIVEVPYGKGTVDVKAGGPVASSNSWPFTYKPPTIESLQPSFGKPGTAVTIKGSDFGVKGISPSFYVKFGKSLGREPKGGENWSDTEITCVAPSDCGAGKNDKKMVTFLVKVAIYQYLARPDLAIKMVFDEAETLAIKKAIEYLEKQGVKIPGEEKKIDVDVKVVTPAGESNTKVFTYEIFETILGELFSPGELRIYDSQGRVTGLVNGEVKEEIPDSLYDPDNETFIVFNASDVYRYEVIGKEKGDYGLKLTYAGKEKVPIFQATDIPTSAETAHQYNIDWVALSEGKEAVTIQVDKEGDGAFEQTFVSDNTLTSDEYLSATAVTPKGKYPITWGDVKQTKLFQNYPNPFNPETWIPYQLSEDSQVVIWIYDTTGNLVRKLDLGQKSAGLHINNDEAVHWNGRNDSGELVASGVYFYALHIGYFRDTKKMVIVR